MSEWLQSVRHNLRQHWRYILSRLLLLTIGALISSIAVAVFYVPADITPTGISGVAVILNQLFSTPIGIVILIANIPILILGYVALRGWRTIAETIYAIVLYSLAVDAIRLIFPDIMATDERMLAALFGGVIGGAGSGLIMRAGGTGGGTATLARVLLRHFGLSLTAASVFTDSLVLVIAAFVFSVEAALYATVGLFVWRLASDFVLSGFGGSKTAVIITRRNADLMRDAIQDYLKHGFTHWRVTGIEHEYRLILVTLQSAEVNGLLKVVRTVDADAFMTVLKGSGTYGEGFKPMHSSLPLYLDEIDDGPVNSGDLDELADRREKAAEKMPS